MCSIITCTGTAFYSLFHLNSLRGFYGLKYVCSVISVKMDSLPANTKNRESTRSWTARVRFIHHWAEIILFHYFTNDRVVQIGCLLYCSLGCFIDLGCTDDVIINRGWESRNKAGGGGAYTLYTLYTHRHAHTQADTHSYSHTHARTHTRTHKQTNKQTNKQTKNFPSPHWSKETPLPAGFFSLGSFQMKSPKKEDPT